MKLSEMELALTHKRRRDALVGLADRLKHPVAVNLADNGAQIIPGSNSPLRDYMALELKEAWALAGLSPTQLSAIILYTLREGVSTELRMAERALRELGVEL